MMVSGVVGRSSVRMTTRRSRWYNRLDWWISYMLVLGLGLVVGFVGFHRSSQMYLGFALACWVALLAMWVRLPRAALAVTITLVLVPDLVTVSWFPFLKNFSSQESIAFLSNSLTITPFELTLVWALAFTAYRNLSTIGRPFRSEPLLRPLMLLLAIVVFAFLLGVSRGGDSRVAIYEARPLLYIPLVYLLVTNVCRTFADYRRMYWAALAGIVIQSILSLKHILRLPHNLRASVDTLNEHGSAIGMNLVFTMTILAFAFRGVPRLVRFTLLLACIPVLWIYLLSQRRAAIVALGAAMILFACMLFWRQRQTFVKVVPIAALLIVAYLGAFWHSTSSAGFPAQAVKTVIAPNSVSASDKSSDQYRKIENFDLHITIRTSPITGLGFGRPFLRPIQLADISSFQFNQYLSHNSFLYVWVRLGFLGFVTVLYLFGRTLMLGADRVRRANPGLDLLVAANAVIFVVMYAVFIYLDVAWEARNVTLLALSMALCTASHVDPSAVTIARPRSTTAAVERNTTTAPRAVSVRHDPVGATSTAQRRRTRSAATGITTLPIPTVPRHGHHEARSTGFAGRSGDASP
jgi:O-antigen ligase